ncbi:MAG: 5'-nucleotidase C-terminal domain-containing protein [Vampirovibrionales bacterium]|jgi:2',3'-cyclic-nucleotide 2'-phosphodiesterase (5'-nucleotidase family)|nr:5'-nucleotidase C-terminal domain-containing protein [Vampirovibrionales bacterium]
MRLSPTLPRLQSASVLHQPPANLARQGRFFPERIPNALRRAFASKVWDNNVVRILGVNDVYRPESLGRGYTVLEKISKEDPDFLSKCLFTFAGDLISPSPESQLTGGRHMVDAMNAINRFVGGQLIAVLGNHEFDLKFANLLKQVKASKFTWLGANVYKNERHLKETPPYKIMKINGRRILVYGVVVPEVYSQLPKNISIKDPLAQVRSELEGLIKERRPDMVILLAHLGEDAYDALHDLPIDLAIVGHEHQASIQTKNGISVVCADSEAKSLIDTKVHFKPKPLLWERLNRMKNDMVFGRMPESQVEKIEVKTVPIPSNTPVSETVMAKINPKIRAYSKSLEAPLARLDRKMNLTSTHLRQGDETAEGNWVADALVHAWNHINPKKPVNIAMIHAGSLRADKEIPKGIFRKRELVELLPYKDKMLRIEATGALIKSLLEEALAHRSSDDIPNRHPGYFMNISGLRVQVDMSKPFGQRVTSITKVKDNKMLDPEEIIYLTIAKFLTKPEGGLSSLPAYVKKHPDRVEEGKKTKDHYIQHHLEPLADGSTLPTISPKTDGRWQITPANPQ